MLPDPNSIHPLAPRAAMTVSPSARAFPSTAGRSFPSPSLTVTSPLSMCRLATSTLPVTVGAPPRRRNRANTAATAIKHAAAAIHAARGRVTILRSRGTGATAPETALSHILARAASSRGGTTGMTRLTLSPRRTSSDSSRSRERSSPSRTRMRYWE